MDIMTVRNDRWKEFTSRLGGPEGCNFREDEKGIMKFDCAGGTNKDKAAKLLTDMGGFDVDASLRYFENNGGHCDCEILFNVAI